ncbi:hypothetical protein [Cytobacillus dafuensis]|uniref:Uncharacterized protein n=1 Tax=Cytobacillus dafuensis TaxID=1742359 RepID=A0A5B8YZZ6_CYTDA|nr:hypothetical protein [Cytobacillus dafuensis]QED46294.1 hypothetical protein FSZ17_02780 [Cytobacillus dafuensis]
MSKEERERLEAKEQRKNPGGTLNSAMSRAMTGSPDGGCLINILSLIMIIVAVLIVKACSG